MLQISINCWVSELEWVPVLCELPPQVSWLIWCWLNILVVMDSYCLEAMDSYCSSVIAFRLVYACLYSGAMVNSCWCWVSWLASAGTLKTCLVDYSGVSSGSLSKPLTSGFFSELPKTRFIWSSYGDFTSWLLSVGLLSWAAGLWTRDVSLEIN